MIPCEVEAMEQVLAEFRRTGRPDQHRHWRVSRGLLQLRHDMTLDHWLYISH